MFRVFDNPRQLKSAYVRARMESLDAGAIVELYSTQVFDENGLPTGIKYYARIESTATDEQIDTALSVVSHLADMFVIKADAAKGHAANIPNWSTWDETQAQTWTTANIATPLANARTNLAAISTLNLATFKAALGAILDILDAMWTMLWAMARMQIALRDKTWPDL